MSDVDNELGKTYAKLDEALLQNKDLRAENERLNKINIALEKKRHWFSKYIVDYIYGRHQYQINNVRFQRALVNVLNILDEELEDTEYNSDYDRIRAVVGSVRTTLEEVKA